MSKAGECSHNKFGQDENTLARTEGLQIQPRTGAARKHDAALLFVHGIGNQKEGDILRKMATPTANQIKRIADKYGWHTEMSQQSLTSPIILTFRKHGRTKTARLDECIWSHSFSKLSPWNVLTWAIGRISSILVLLFPDRRDLRTLLTPLAYSNADRMKTSAAQIMAIMRSLLRIFLFIGVMCFAIRFVEALASFMSKNFQAFLLSLLPILACVFLFRNKWNYLAQIPAATSSSPRQEMVEAVKSSAIGTSKLAKHPIIVAHSQGGFLAYNALSELNSSRKATKKWGFIGVGSGLRPLTFLNRLNDNWTMAFWWSLVPVAVMFVAVLLDSLRRAGIMEVFRSLATITIVTSQCLLGLIPSPNQITLAISFLELNSQSLLLKTSSLTPYFPTLFLLSGFSGIVGLLAKRYARAPLLQEPLTFPKSVGSWTELSTVHDLVGRLVLAPLPKRVKHIDLSGPSNVILDHTSYFTASLFPYFAAIEAVTDIGLLKPDELNKECNELNSLNIKVNELSQRRWHTTTFVIFAASICGLVKVFTTASAPKTYLSAILFFSVLVTFYSIVFRLIEVAWTQFGPLNVYSAISSEKRIAYISKQYDKMKSVLLLDRLLGLCLAYLGLCTFIAAADITPTIGLGVSDRTISSLELIGELALIAGTSLLLRYRPWCWLYFILSIAPVYRVISEPPILISTVSIKIGLPALCTIGGIVSLVIALQCARKLIRKGRKAEDSR